MNGVIIFADDDVLKPGRPENSLFNTFINSEDELTVIPVSTLEHLSGVLRSVSTIRCLILDWTFEKEIEGISKKETPLAILRENNIYSLVYIYSRDALTDETRTELDKRLGNKIRYREKNNDLDPDKEFADIMDEIKSLEGQNSHMQIPKLWSQTINQAVQELFVDFEQATNNWITDIRDSAKSDGSDGASEVISVFQNVLSENLIQHPILRAKIDALVANGETSANEKVAQLYRHIMYLKVLPETPLTTGDIFKFAEDYYGILISPECEIGNLSELAFLIISHTGYIEYINKTFSKGQESGWYSDIKPKDKPKYRGIFHNGVLSCHILPSFPFDDNNNKAGYINFKTGFRLFPKDTIMPNRIPYRLMAPYIHQLRQRYLSFFGKYGVSEFPNSLKDHNLNW